ncbi:hypothetical protein ACRARG_04730 [Pseudooceanicola sp. C21-150M6]|uniref:hypothetical protein n=1 Tax=Pseudooceanicola sp. C21-150M6 TaxID=3434355 RepID=UPI003D7F7DC2
MTDELIEAIKRDQLTFEAASRDGASEEAGYLLFRRKGRFEEMESCILAYADRIEALEAKVAAADRLVSNLESYKQAESAADDTASPDDYEFVFEVWEELEAALAAYQSTPTPRDPVREAAPELLEAAKALRDDMLTRARIDRFGDEERRIVAAGNGAWIGFTAAIRRAEGGE